MKNYFLLVVTLSIISFSCERKFNSKSSNVSFDFSSQNISNKILTQNLTATDRNIVSIDEFTCFGVSVSGPEPELRQNSCKKSTSANTFVKPVGLIVGSVKSGEKLAMEVPAGNDRVFTIYGFKTSDGYCPQINGTVSFDKLKSTKPYILGESSAVQLVAGENKNLEIKMNFDSTNWVNECSGPDLNYSFNDDIAGSIPETEAPDSSVSELIQVNLPTENPNTLLIQQKFKAEHMSKNICLPIDILFFRSVASVPVTFVKLPQALPLEVHLSTTSGGKEVFEEATCANALTPSSGIYTVSAASGTYRKRIFIKTQTSESITINARFTIAGSIIQAAASTLMTSNDVSASSPNVLKVHNPQFEYSTDQKMATLPMGALNCREVYIYPYFSSSFSGVVSPNIAIIGLDVSVVTGRNVLSNDCEDTTSTGQLSLSIPPNGLFTKFAVRKFSNSTANDTTHIQINYNGTEYPSIRSQDYIFAKDVYVQY